MKFVRYSLKSFVSVLAFAPIIILSDQHIFDIFYNNMLNGIIVLLILSAVSALVMIDVDMSMKKFMNQCCLNEEKYYRESLGKYSPSALCYVYFGKLNYTRCLVTTMLRLITLDRIKIENDKIVVLNNNPEGLFKTEILVLNAIENGVINSKKINEKNFENEIHEELKNYYSEHDFAREKVGKHYFNLLFIIVTSIAFILEFGNFNGELIEIFKALCIPFMIVFIATYNRQINSYHISFNRKGDELYTNLIGMKKYFRDFTQMKEKSIGELDMWEDYMMYSVILEENNKVYKKCKQYITNC